MFYFLQTSETMKARAVALMAWWSLVTLSLATGIGEEVVGHPSRNITITTVPFMRKIFKMPSEEARLLKQQEVPPEFMMDLYKALEDPSGLTDGDDPYNADIIRSFMELDTSTEQFFLFNISGMEPEELLLEAELHLYCMRQPANEDHMSIPSSTGYLLQVYQVTDDQALAQPGVHRLLSTHHINNNFTGWLTVNVTQAVHGWVNKESPNLGLLVVATSAFGKPAMLPFARRNIHHNSKQPILVLYNSDGQRPARKERRKISGSINSTNSSSLRCSRHPLYADFAKLGWDSWIIAPPGYMMYQCKGHCKYSKTTQGVTNHAIVQLFLHWSRLAEDGPCCAPHIFKPVRVIGFADKTNMVLWKWKDAVVESCGCR